MANKTTNEKGLTTCWDLQKISESLFLEYSNGFIAHKSFVVHQKKVVHELYFCMRIKFNFLHRAFLRL